MWAEIWMRSSLVVVKGGVRMVSALRPRAIRASVLLVSLLTVAAGGMTRASAFTGTGPLECVATPNLTIVQDAPSHYLWTLTGGGACVGNRSRGTFGAQLNATGTSNGLGLCDGLLVQNLRLNVTLTITRLSTGVTQTEEEQWVAPITTFPIVTPFIVRVGKKGVGLGAIASHISGKCPPGGTGDSTVAWIQNG